MLNTFRFRYTIHSKYSKRVHSLHHTFFIHDVGLETKHSKHHQCGQDGGKEIDDRHQDSIKMAVVVPLVIAGESNDSTEAQAQCEEDLGCSLTPYLWLQHDLQLQLYAFRKMLIYFSSIIEPVCMYDHLTTFLS